MNVQTLNDKLINNAELIRKILNKLELNNIQEIESQGLFKFPRPEGDNTSGILLYIDKLRVIGVTDPSYSGNIYTLVMKIKKCNFPEALEKIGRWIGIKNETYKINRPFSGFYLNILRDKIEPESYLKSYSESILPIANNYSKAFLDDGIKLDVQQKLGIRYSIEDDATLIPIYTLNDKLVGVKARNNNKNCDFNHRWYAWIPYSKTCVVYGLNVNYENIIKKRTLVIFESEKSVGQTLSMGFNCGCAIGGHNISDVQVRIIKSLMVDNIIVAFDEGLSEEEIIYECKKLKSDSTIYTNNVSYIYDKEHKYLLEGSKDSPSDNGKDILNDLLKECRHEI